MVICQPPLDVTETCKNICRISCGRTGYDAGDFMKALFDILPQCCDAVVMRSTVLSVQKDIAACYGDLRPIGIICGLAFQSV